MHYYAQRAWGDAAHVASAGTWAEIGMDATREIRRAAEAHGLAFPRHSPTQLDDQNLFHADLVLIATHHHESWISRRLGVVPDHVWGIRQAAALAQRATPPAGDTAAERLRNVAAALKTENDREPEPLRSLDDPYGRDQATFDRVMAEIAADIDALTAWARLDS
jgi:protein-tyrosine-phosphatase